MFLFHNQSSEFMFGFVSILLSLVVLFFALLCGGAFDIVLEELHNGVLGAETSHFCQEKTVSIVVLGHQLNEDGSASVALTERVDAAVSFYRACVQQRRAVSLIFSGGTPLGRPRSEASVMQVYDSPL